MKKIWTPGDYYNFKIAVVGKKYLFVPYRDAMVNSLRNLGIKAEGFEEVDGAYNYDPQVIVIINPLLYPLPPKSKKKNIIFVAVQTEQLDTPFSGKVFGKNHTKQLEPYLNKYDLILDWSEDHIELLKKITKTRSVFFPHSYFPGLEPETEDYCNSQIDDPEYDIIFIGNMPGVDERRKRAMEYLSGLYKTYPIRNDLWAEKKPKALKSAKICLNIHFEESRCMESPRLYDYFANHCFVISEPIHSSTPFVCGRDYIEFYWTNACQTIDYYLNNPALRKEISDNAYATLRSVDMNETIKILVEEIISLRYKRT